MSLISLANHAARRPARPPVDVQGGLEAIPGEEGVPPVAAPADEGPQPPAPVAGALERLVEFIPTETIALYWVAIPAAEGLQTYYGSGSFVATWINTVVYWGLLGLTPVFLVLAFLSAKAAASQPCPKWQYWPWWKMLAATISFSVWGLAVPKNPYFSDPPLLMGMWVLAMLVATLLSLLDPIVMNWWMPTPPEGE